MRRPSLTIGDVIEITAPCGKAYAQFTHEHPDYGELVRVLPGLYNERPSLPEVVLQKERFVAFLPLRAALRRGIFEVVGNYDVPEPSRRFPTFKLHGGIDPVSGRALNWWIRDGTSRRRVDQLSDEERRLPTLGIWNDTILVERICSEWSPVDDVK